MPMSEGGEKPGVKDVFGVIKKSPALMIAGIVGVLFVMFLIIKKGPAGNTTSMTSTTPDSASLAATTSPGGYYGPQLPYIEPAIITINSTSSPMPAAISAVAPGAASSITMPAPMNTTPAPALPPSARTIPSTDPMHTPGESDNFWVYTTRAGDTLDSLTSAFNWQANKQVQGGPSFTYKYRNNADIFTAVGISPNNPYAQIPAGTKISA